MKRISAAGALALALLLPSPTWAAVPTFVANGSAGVTGSATTCTPTMPVSISADDILILVACGESDDVGGTLALTTANGFALVTVSVGSNPGSTDNNNGVEADPEIDCGVWWKRAVGGDAAPVVTDSGDHTTCAIHQFRGVKTSGNPWNVAVNGNDGGVNDTSGVIPGATTTAADTLVVLVQGTSNNATSAANCGAATNADLTTITERFDSTNTIGLGGGHCVITGQKASASAYADSTLTLSATTFKQAFSIALEPPAAATCTGQIALTGAGCK